MMSRKTSKGGSSMGTERQRSLRARKSTTKLVAGEYYNANEQSVDGDGAEDEVIESSEEEALDESDDSDFGKRKRLRRSSVRKPPAKRRSSQVGKNANPTSAPSPPTKKRPDGVKEDLCFELGTYVFRLEDLRNQCTDDIYCISSYQLLQKFSRDKSRENTYVISQQYLGWTCYESWKYIVVNVTTKVTSSSFKDAEVTIVQPTIESIVAAEEEFALAEVNAELGIFKHKQRIAPRIWPKSEVKTENTPVSKPNRHRNTNVSPADWNPVRLPETPFVGDDQFHAYIQVLLSHALDRQFLQKIASRETALEIMRWLFIVVSDIEKLKALEVVDEKNQKLLQYIKDKDKLADEIATICRQYTLRSQITVNIASNEKCKQCHLTNKGPSQMRYKYIFEGFEYDKETLLYKDGDITRRICQVVPLCSMHAQIVKQFFVLSHLRYNIFIHCCKKIAVLKCLYREFADDQLVDKASSDHIWMSGMTSEYLKTYKKIENKRG